MKTGNLPNANYDQALPLPNFRFKKNLHFYRKPASQFFRFTLKRPRLYIQF
jgi:hypothetical protein